MRKRRIALGALTFTACSPVMMGDAGTTVDSGGPDAGRSDAGTDAGYDAGVPDAGRPDAGGCPCIGARTGRCLIPSDFPPDAAQYMVEAVCDCQYVPVFVCPDETDLRCSSWACHPERQKDGGSGVERTADGGFTCLC